jgi:Cysteine-rich secretory protein family
MRGLRRVILLPVAAATCFGPGATGLRGQHPRVDIEKSKPCTTLSRDELEKSGHRPSADELVRELPSPPSVLPETQQQCPTPAKEADQPTQPNRPLLGGGIVRPKTPFEELEDEAEDALDDLDDAMDDCDLKAVKDMIPRLQELAKRAHDVAKAARAAGKFSAIDPKEAEAMAKDLDDAIQDAKNFKCIIKPPTYRFVPMQLSPLNERILYMHNQERQLVHAQPLKWNFKLEWDAIAYADHIAETHQLIHAPREGRGIERENLQQTMIGWGPDRMLHDWIGEKRDFVAGYYPNVARDGNWMNVSHYTQMIWPTTTDMGCGYAEGGGFGWLVCRYSPGGNKDGKPVGIASPQPERG